MIRRLELEDIEHIVAVHVDSFHGFFFSFLGHRFLALYYAGICNSPEGIGFIYLNSLGQAIGFVAGACNPRSFYSKLLRGHWFGFSLASLGAILRKPSVMRRIARAFFHPSENPPGNDVAGLFSIAVLPAFQGTGVGKTLLQAFLKEARLRDCKRVFLTTDHDNNEVVNTFYQRMGFKIERQYTTPEGRSMNEYWLELN